MGVSPIPFMEEAEWAVASLGSAQPATASLEARGEDIPLAHRTFLTKYLKGGGGVSIEEKA